MQVTSDPSLCGWLSLDLPFLKGTYPPFLEIEILSCTTGALMSTFVASLGIYGQFLSEVGGLAIEAPFHSEAVVAK